MVFSQFHHDIITRKVMLPNVATSTSLRAARDSWLLEPELVTDLQEVSFQASNVDLLKSCPGWGARSERGLAHSQAEF